MVVTSSPDENDIFRQPVLDHVPLGPGLATATKAHVHHVSTVVNGVADAVREIAEVARTLVAQRLDRHNQAFETACSDSLAVVRRSRSEPGHLRTVVRAIVGDSVVVVVLTVRLWIRIRHVVDEVPAVHVVHKAVVVVVNPVSGDFVRVRPDLAGQVGMINVHTRIHDPDYHRARALLQVPGLRSVDVLQVPLLVEQGIIRREMNLVDVVGFGVFHVGKLAQLLCHKRRRVRATEVNFVDSIQSERLRFGT